MNQPKQQQELPGHEAPLRPQPDHGEPSYRGSGRLAGEAVILTGGDSGGGPHMAPGSALITTASVNSDMPRPTLLIPATMEPEEVERFGQDVPMKRAGQPAEVAPVYVLLASHEASYISGAGIAVTGGKPIIQAA